jgi:hypothetical protein
VQIDPVHLDVALRGVEPRMPEQLLHGGDVRPLARKIGGSGWPRFSRGAEVVSMLLRSQGLAPENAPENA